MCTSPSFVWVKRGPEWLKVPAPCDLCWSCKENYVNDWVGRCLCEAATSQVSVTLSLTYAPPVDPRDFSHRVVNPHHFQLFIKRLRKAGHKIRYLVAGEYGETYDRAHFHAILFFSDLKDRGTPAPKLEDRKAFRLNPDLAAPLSRQMPQQDMCHIREWPHGHVVADWSCSEKSVRYCCEYLYHSGKKNSWLSMSKKPALGAAWFAAKAARNIELSVMPSTFEYMPPGGKPGRKYLMTGATRRDYLNLIVRDRAKRPFMSKWVRATFDKLERQEFIDDCSLGFNDEAFLERQMPLEKQRNTLVWQEGLEKIAADVISSRIAREWGFENVEEWEAFCEAGGPEARPDLLAPVTGRSVHLPGGSGAADAPLTSRPPTRKSPKRAPTGYDRQGVAYWGDPERDYLATAFERSDPTDRQPQDGELQADPAQE